jgi:hypothetical protein
MKRLLQVIAALLILATAAAGCPYAQPYTLESPDAGSGGGHEPCTCPASTACLFYECDAGACHPSLVAAGISPPALTQTPGNCSRTACDGSGGIEFIPDVTDTPTSPDPCTTLGCNTGGAITESFVPYGIPSKTAGMFCDGAGNCVGCMDGMKDGKETAVDCGGPNCPGCDGDPCSTNSDCKSMSCQATYCRTLNAGSCTDPYVCPSNFCKSGQCAACTSDADCNNIVGGCMSGVCRVPPGAPCESDSDCGTGTCVGHLCKLSDNVSCTTGSQCWGGKCLFIGAVGKCTSCTYPGDCGSITCASGTCLLTKGNYCTLNSQCNSGTCTGFPPKCT